MNITIKENLISTLERLAQGQYQTSEDFASGYINAYLASQKRDEVIAMIDSDIPTYEAVIVAKKEEIQETKRQEQVAYELANPVIEKIEDTEATTTPQII